MKTQIGGVTVEVPVHETPEQTRMVVDRLNAVYAEIEAESERIDTQRFALLAAYRFAAENERLRQEHAADAARLKQAQHAETQELLAALDRLSGSLRRLVNEFKPPVTP